MSIRNLFIIIILLKFANARNNVCSTWLDYFTIDSNKNCYYDPDIFSMTPDIMRNHKRDFETYDVTTEDGYILTMFRLPKKDNPKGVVLLQHPLTTDAIVWVSQGNSSLAFLMSDAGYDVWMANHRGTFFSAKHVNLSVDDPKFWDYSFHEIGLYDISAEVKFIKEKTNRSDIIFIGHSMAVTASLIYTSLRPDEAASSLKINIAMSPAAYSKHVTSPLKFVAPFMPFIEVMNNIFGYYYLFRYKDFLSLFGKICIFSPLKFLCTAPYWFAFGFTPNEYDPSLVNHAFSLNPRAVAWKIIYHYAQNVNADGIFQMYDYGGAQNLYLYEKEAPPEYPLQNIRVPFYAILGDADTTCTLEVVLIFGISGACRREELVKMTIDNIEDLKSILVIKIPDTKTHSERTFTVSNLEYINIYKKYRSLRPAYCSSNRLFVKYAKGKCINQHVGVNKIGEIPSLIAKWLGKEMYKSYTGHCFRRSSATLLANAGGDMISIKRHGGWRSSTVAEGYIEDSLSNKIDISNKILECQSSSTIENLSRNVCSSNNSSCADQQFVTSSAGINIGGNCSKFTINYYCSN